MSSFTQLFSNWTHIKVHLMKPLTPSNFFHHFSSFHLFLHFFYIFFCCCLYLTLLYKYTDTVEDQHGSSILNDLKFLHYIRCPFLLHHTTLILYTQMTNSILYLENHQRTRNKCAVKKNSQIYRPPLKTFLVLSIQNTFDVAQQVADVFIMFFFLHILYNIHTFT